MLIFRRLLHDKGMDWIRVQREGHAAFIQMRDEYVNVCIRAVRERQHRPSVLAWCNAAAWLLEIADEELQHEFFQASNDEREAWIVAIVADGGLPDAEGRWIELPYLGA